MDEIGPSTAWFHCDESLESGATRMIPSFAARSFHGSMSDMPWWPEPCNSSNAGAFWLAIGGAKT